MHTPLVRTLRHTALGAFALLLLSAAQAEPVRYYRAGDVPSPAVVATILGKGKTAARIKMRGRGDYDEPAAVQPVLADAGTVVQDDTLARETQLSASAKTAVQAWQARLDAGAAPAPPPATATLIGSALALAINFDNDSARLQAADLPSLDAIAEGMRRVGYARPFVIEGHTSASGSAAHNLRLSRLRADSVKRYLVSQQAIPAAALRSIGLGSRAPLDATHPYAAANRRVQFRAA